MALQTNSDEWQQATTQKRGKTDNNTDISAKNLIEALSDLEKGLAYSTVELYNYIVHGDLESDNEPTSDDLKAFVPAYSALVDDNECLVDKHRKQAEIGDEFDIERKKIGESGYENWYFALMGKGDQ